MYSPITRLFLCLLLCLCACGTRRDDTRPTLRLWKASHGEQAHDWHELLKPFLAAHPGLHVEVLSHPWNGWDERYATAYSGGLEPDVAYMPDEFWPRFAAAGLLARLDEQFPQATNAMQKDYPPNLWQLGSLQGHQYGVPYLYVSWHLLYNRALFDAAKLPYPPATSQAPGFDDWTWERFFEAGRALTLDNDGDGRVDQWGFAWGALAANPNAIYPFLWQGGADLLDSTGKRNGLVPHGEVGLGFLARLAAEGLVPEGGLHPGPQDLFYRGRAAMMLTAQASTRVVRRDFPELDIGAAIVPQGPARTFYDGRGTFGNAGFWVLSSRSKYPKEALALLRFLSAGPQADIMMRKFRLLGARLDWQEPGGEPLLETFISGRRYLVPYPLHPRLRLVHSAIMAEVQAMLLGRATPAQANAAAARAIDALLSLR
jgi:multiple sugar transport system substrate-binding protein